MREITGTGEGNGPYIAISNGLTNIDIWAGLLPNADRVALDTHPYFAFNGEPNTAPVNVLASDGQMGGTWSERACTAWKEQMNTMYATIRSAFRRQEVNQFFPSQTSFGVTFAGEYSNAINDCGTYLRSVEPYTPANPDCDTWNDWQNWDQATKDGILSFALASMDALENPFFWTWKVRESARSRRLLQVSNRFFRSGIPRTAALNLHSGPTNSVSTTAGCRQTRAVL